MIDNTKLVAAVPFVQDDPVDSILKRVTETLLAEGYRVVGFLQFATDEVGECRRAIEVENIETGERHQIMQTLGLHARGCRLDPHAMTTLTASLSKAVEFHPDIVILNRFGKGESEGTGLRSVFETVAIANIPLLTPVKQSYIEPWVEFSDGFSISLEQEEQAVLVWCRQAIKYARRLRNAA